MMRGVNTVPICEVWLAHLVALGIGADVGNLVEVGY